MNILEAIFLGIIQGITEFLPISSTGHLTLAGKFMNLISPEHPEQWTAFIAVIQIGTLIAVLIYFWKDILNIISSFFKQNIFSRRKFSEQDQNSRLGWFIIIGTIPVIIFGLLFKHIIEGSLTKNLYVISGSLIGLAVILAVAERTAKFRKEIKDISAADSFLIGVAQSFALIPGSSRSGTTITGGLFLGLNREAAARFSFLLSIPAVFASGLLELYESLKFLDASMSINLAVATVFSAASGYAAIDFLLKYLRKNSTFVFIYYRIVLGLFILILLWSNIILP
ncbi:MAG TPA: undecaprenyl-diphosphatase UppP [Ignavibacteriaceae bacterium]|nr:undecaprenyl-diphosphatase UppP [Ignavibacteriaceae bacterium]